MSASGRLALREGRLPDDEPYFARFINGLQAFEHPMEPNRRLDEAVGAEYLEVLKDTVRAQNGRIYVLADDADRPVGWVVGVIERAELFVTGDWRNYGLITELYIDETARGQGGGKRLIEACEAHFRACGVKYAALGVLWGNERARSVYGSLGYAPTDLRMRKRL